VNIQEVLAGGLFIVALFWLGLRLWKSVRPNKNTGCEGCGSNGHKTKNPAEAGS